MDSSVPKKKKLDFTRPTFTEPDFKIPCRDLTNTHEKWNNTGRSVQPSEKSSFADDEESSRDSDMSTGLSVLEEKVSVYLRLKPTKYEVPDLYQFDEIASQVYLKGNQLNQLTTVERQYTFSHILNQTANQADVYNNCVRPLLESPFLSSGAVVASYGVSNSGKTYTILGEKSAGVVPRALTQIFTEYGKHIASYPYLKVVNEQISILNDAQVKAEIDTACDFLQESRQVNKGKLHDGWIDAIKEDHQFGVKELTSDYQKILVWVSFAEIYNEKMIDLFKTTKVTASVRPNSLKIISNNGNPYVLGLTWIHVSNIETALELLQHGLRRVNYAPTGLNAHSSRSHTIFTINLISECEASYEYSSFKFCDLAGAERISKTGNFGDRLKEAGGINTSLLVLGRCLDTVQHNQRPGAKKDVVPVRESKLTFLLQSSLLGHEKFVMIVNLLPTADCFEENINVLHFGSIANKIVTRKTDVKKFVRCSSRYTFFMQHAVNSPKMNSSLAFEESLFLDRDESSLDLSFKRNNMSADELRHELRRKDIECDCYRNAIEQKEREFLQREREIRQENIRTQTGYRESEKQYYEEKEKILKDYHDKKIDSLRKTHERKFNNLLEEIDFLERENLKLKRKLGVNDDDGVIDLGDDEEDESEDDDGEEIIVV